MIKKLRAKFIILSSFSLLLLLGIIVVSSNFLAYRELVENADMVLERLNENGGRPSKDIKPPKMLKFKSKTIQRMIREYGIMPQCRLRQCMRQDFSL
jgi:hypothetical protein